MSWSEIDVSIDYPMVRPLLIVFIPLLVIGTIPKPPIRPPIGPPIGIIRPLDWPLIGENKTTWIKKMANNTRQGDDKNFIVCWCSLRFTSMTDDEDVSKESLSVSSPFIPNFNDYGDGQRILFKDSRRNNNHDHSKQTLLTVKDDERQTMEGKSPILNFFSQRPPLVSLTLKVCWHNCLIGIFFKKVYTRLRINTLTRWSYCQEDLLSVSRRDDRIFRQQHLMQYLLFMVRYP